MTITTRLNKNISARLDRYEASGKSITGTKIELIKDSQGREPLTPKQEEAMRVFANIKENNKFAIASKILGISKPSVFRLKAWAEMKGYTIEEFKKPSDVESVRN